MRVEELLVSRVAINYIVLCYAQRPSSNVTLGTTRLGSCPIWELADLTPKAIVDDLSTWIRVTAVESPVTHSICFLVTDDYACVGPSIKRKRKNT